ncbi:hypothetical protein AB6A40_008961 [Gnathostoma spinigerum]|uniref:Uncharacterized protein n=1 Tax=Gnathostoma spinigerum TaxID=75299 RepID=A0ABD6EZV5_9BILA
MDGSHCSIIKAKFPVKYSERLKRDDQFGEEMVEKKSEQIMRKETRRMDGNCEEGSDSFRRGINDVENV